MTIKVCSKCKKRDGEFPYTLFGETGQIIKLRGKIVCYNCWCIAKYGKGA